TPGIAKLRGERWQGSFWPRHGRLVLRPRHAQRRQPRQRIPRLDLVAVRDDADRRRGSENGARRLLDVFSVEIAERFDDGSERPGLPALYECRDGGGAADEGLPTEIGGDQEPITSELELDAGFGGGGEKLGRAVDGGDRRGHLLEIEEAHGDGQEPRTP